MGERVIVRTVDRPDLVPIVAEWLWREFWQPGGFTLEQTRKSVAASLTRLGLPQCFVLLIDGKPIGTASLAASDLEERPDLTPWLASVFIIPEARGRSLVTHLIEAVEAECRAASVPTLWLFTNTAERVYARAGWHSVETVRRQNKPSVILMRRNLFAQGTAQAGQD
jgi:N-acetylglutamate synthase-like GNAT family acetyltransferase